MGKEYGRKSPATALRDENLTDKLKISNDDRPEKSPVRLMSINREPGNE
jgi:hypothetical protein